MKNLFDALLTTGTDQFTNAARLESPTTQLHQFVGTVVDVASQLTAAISGHWGHAILVGGLIVIAGTAGYALALDTSGKYESER